MARKKQPKKLTNKEINQARKLSRELDLLTEDTPKELIDKYVEKTGTKIGRMKDPKKIVAKVKANHNKYMTSHNISKPLKRGNLDSKGRYTSVVNENYKIPKSEFDAYEKEVEKARVKLKRLRGNEIFGMIMGDIPFSKTSKGKPIYNTTHDSDYLLFKHNILEAKSPIEMKDSSWLNARMTRLKDFNSKSFVSNYAKSFRENVIKGLTETYKTTIMGDEEAKKVATIVKNMTNKEIIQFSLLIRHDGNDLFKIIYEGTGVEIVEYLEKLYAQASDIKRVQAQQKRVSKFKDMLEKDGD